MPSRSACFRLVPFPATALHALLAGWLAVGALASGPDFRREVLPILSDKCFHCHGPSETGRKAGLRLDTREGAVAVNAKGRAAVVPGRPEDSGLVARILTDDPDDRMPPPESHRELSDSQRETLRQWVAAGAPWGRHWAFEPVVRPPLPVAPWPDRVRNGIDRFVFAGLAAAGLKPAPEADRTTLLRRVSLHLTGLPPTPEELETFLADRSPDAYERQVDRLLASAAYGERMAVEWMDLARFADTYGYQSDVDVDLSPWRDWVIRSFNDNLPYDRFLGWQLAGDLLPGATADQMLATAFNRLHRQTNEGGSIEEEWRAEYVADRVHTFGTAMLGLTLECARCHDHKYDPVSQRDYYGLAAFFNNIDESGLYSHFTQSTPTPAMLLYAPGQEEEHRRLREAVGVAEAALRSEVAAAAGRMDPDAPVGSQDVPAPVAWFPFDEAEGGRSPDRVDPSRAATGVGELVPGAEGRAVAFNGDDAVTCGGVGRFSRNDPFSLAFRLQPGALHARAVVLHGSRAWTDSGSRGYEVVLDQGRVFFGLIHFWPGNAAAIRTRQPLDPAAWTRVTVTYDGSSRAAGMAVYLDGVRADCEVVRDGLTRDIRHRREWGDSDVDGLWLSLGARFRDNGLRGGRLDDLRVFDTDLTPWEARRLAGDAGDPDAGARREQWVRRGDPGVRTAREALRGAREAEDAFVTRVREMMVMREMDGRRPTFVLNRGAYDAPGDAVTPAVPDRILPWPEGAPRNRLGLARWLTDPSNPLTARVAVNRFWKLHFGQGLVSTVEDFGIQGRAPTHPELLDWLAAGFRDGGWDRKALHRLIVTSATYRQDSRADDRLRAIDPDNRLLARGPRHRLAGEVVRDRALAASGLLVGRVGGRSVKPYQPPGVWEESGTGKSYRPDTGAGLYRRSLYTFWRRTAPPPSMLTFDATAREVCTAKRESTATPLQALVLLNDPQYLEAARVLAAGVLRECGDDTGRFVEAVFLRLLGRRPDAAESDVLVRMFDGQEALFATDPSGAEAFLGVGSAPRPADLPAVRLAAATAVASAVLNHDEFVTQR